jgi:acetyltransferase-like isoleucine patch superfamily enzyme
MVVIRDQDHKNGTSPSSGTFQKFVCSPITIKEGVWIASKATILKGVIIEKGAVIAASAVVTKNVGPNELWGGIPAKYMKNLAYQ